MINRIKFFSVMKAKASENPKLPTHSISVKIGEEFVTVGGSWTKQTIKGDKFLSSKLQDAWVDAKDNTKARTGFSIVYDKDIDMLESLAEAGKKPEPLIDPSDGRDLSGEFPF